MPRRLLALTLLAAPLAAQQPVPELLAEYDQLAAAVPWPGFTPGAIPLAIYDGARTWLVRHPAPPPEFAPAPGHPGMLVAPGQHAAVRGNTSVELAGVATATLLWRPAGPSPRRAAATLLHEAFHVHQRARHPRWSGNEATRFTYPVTDTVAQRLQRLETEALRRALARPGSAGCWGSRAVELRRERAERLGGEPMAYERGNDLNEGLATWLEYRALRLARDSVIPAAGFAPDAVRLRAYAVGPAQAMLLDQLRPGWPHELVADSSLTLDALLARATAPLSCRADFARAERDSVHRLAAAEAGAVLAQRAAARADYLTREGWELRVRLPAAQPLWPERFDPWNLTPLADGEVLHQRHVRLGGAPGRLEVLDRWALTRPAGAHPLFNGIREVVVTGLPARPALETRGDSLLVRGPGLEGAFTGLVVRESGTLIVLEPR